VLKPFSVEEVMVIIDRALEKRNLIQEVAYLKGELKRFHPFEKMVGQDRKILGVFDLITTIAESDGSVFIQGESGTGKELVARAIHNRSPRKDRPFVVINCAAIPEALMESEIFGYVKGAFTGAINTSMGKLDISSGGTVFLDDIDSLDVNMQAKLLRVIQEKEFERLGSNKILKVDARFVAASNKDVAELIAEGRFREDLYYRLNVFPVRLPPLRERRGDIALLLNHFLEVNAKKTGKPGKRFSDNAMKMLMKYDWPGNVRELENLVERLATVVKRPVIRMQDITPPEIGLRKIRGMNLKDAVSMFEKQYILETLESVDGNRTEAAEVLGIHRNTLLRKLEGGQT
jgi:DNA-binding NtrC family response regulator